MATVINSCPGHLLITPSSSSRYSSFGYTICSSNVFQSFDLSCSTRNNSQVVWIDRKLGTLVRLKASSRARARLLSSRKGFGGSCSCELDEFSAASGSQRNSSTSYLAVKNDSFVGLEAPVLPRRLKQEHTDFELLKQCRLDGGKHGLVNSEHLRLVTGFETTCKDQWWEEPGNLLCAEDSKRWSWGMGLMVIVPGMMGLNLSGPQSVLEALGVLAAIITVHEAGHFLAARLQNIHVTKFAVGFGPTLAKFQKNGVEYSLRAFPFGGFVAFPDDDPNSEFSPDDPDLLKNRPILDRVLVISAGVIANLIFAYSVLFVQALEVGLLEREILPGVVVPEVITKSAAARAGMRAGDVVLSVDGFKLSAKDSAVFELVDTIKKNPGRQLELFVQRGADVVGMHVIPDENKDGTGRIGVQLSTNGKPHRVKANGVADAFGKSSQEFVRLTATVTEGLKQIFFNFEKTVDSVSGPVAIVAVGAEVARSDIAGLYQFAAVVNINLAIVNLLPLPALDGGYLAFVLLEALRGGKKLPEGVEQGIMSSGILLLLALGIVLMVRDTMNLGFVQQML